MVVRRSSTHMPKDPEQELAETRERTAGYLAGTILRPMPVCRECGQSALVKELRLEMDEGRGMTGTSVGVQGALCLDQEKKCGCAIVQDGGWRQGFNWRYGTQRVQVVEGEPYLIKQLPFNFTEQQRQRMQTFLEDTDPKARA